MDKTSWALLPSLSMPAPFLMVPDCPWAWFKLQGTFILPRTDTHLALPVGRMCQCVAEEFTGVSGLQKILLQYQPDALYDQGVASTYKEYRHAVTVAVSHYLFLPEAGPILPFHLTGHETNGTLSISMGLRLAWLQKVSLLPTFLTLKLLFQKKTQVTIHVKPGSSSTTDLLSPISYSSGRRGKTDMHACNL